MGFLSDLLAKFTKKTQDTVPSDAQTNTTATVAVDTEEESDLHSEEDSEDETDEDAASEDMDAYDQDDFGPFEALAKTPTAASFEEFWYQVHKIEKEGSQSDQALEAAFAAKGIRNNLHFQQIRETFNRHFGQLHEFQQAMFNARGRQGKEELQEIAARNPGMFLPVDGVDLKTFATIQARMMQSGSSGPGAAAAILADYHLTDQKWNAVNQEWLSRMSNQSDPMAAITLNGEYGKYFAEAGQGNYGASAQAASSQIGVGGVAGQAPGVGTEPCSLERYAELAAAQEVWAEQGLDISEMLKKVFQLTIMDWSNMSAWWSVKIQSDYRLGLKLYNELVPAYKAQYQNQSKSQ